MAHRRLLVLAANVGLLAGACRSDEGASGRKRTGDARRDTAPVDPAPVDTRPDAVVPRDVPVDVVIDAAVASAIDAGPQDACAIACQFARDCALGTATCEEDCRTSKQLRACLELAGPTECGRAAACGLRVMCGGKEPRGSGACKDAMTCQSQCPAGDLACGCACIPAMAAKHALALARVDVCAINCNYDEACMRARCSVWALACAAK